MVDAIKLVSRNSPATPSTTMAKMNKSECGITTQLGYAGELVNM
jgi:hypothetical protein